MPLLTHTSITQKIIKLNNPKEFKWVSVFEQIKSNIKDYIIKLNLIKTTKEDLYFNVVYLNDFEGYINDPFVPNTETPYRGVSTQDTSCLIIPTGIGARLGGYAGDANPLAKFFAASSTYLITHPNVVNGAVLSDLPQNIIYTEGFFLEQFLLGKVSFLSTNKNKIGVIFDKAINEERLDYELNVLNALRVFYGCDISFWTVTDKPLNIKPSVTHYGFSSGTIENIETLLASASKLKSQGVTAIAICSQIFDIESNKQYIYGEGIDPIGGIEAIISHTVSAYTGLISANAPVLIGGDEINYKNIAPVSASEYIAKSFLPSVISGLRFAPMIKHDLSLALTVQSLNKVVVPYNAFGSPAIMFLNDNFKDKVILIRQNKTCLDVKPEHLNTKFNYINSYKDLFTEEEINKAGIDISVLERPIKRIPNL